MLMKYLSIKRLTWLCIAALSTPVFTSCDMMTEDRRQRRLSHGAVSQLQVRLQS